MSRNHTRAFAAIALSALLFLSGCSTPTSSLGGNGSLPSLPTSTITPIQPAPTGSNVDAISVYTGAYASADIPYENGAFTNVTICTPGNPNQCQTIDGILVDTGSYGLRILSSAISVPLNQQTDSSGNPIVECAEFASGFTWGPVQTTDLTVAGETASSMPMEVLGSPSFPDADAPADSCVEGDAGESNDLDLVENLGANGILGIGSFPQDCGQVCTPSSTSNAETNPVTYWSCNTAATCVLTTEALSAQVANPVPLFPVDNNGVMLEFPAVDTGSVAQSMTGYLIFGIGTENNNGLGSATIYDLDTTFANLTTSFEGNTYSDASFLDSGSIALYFDPTGTDLASTECADLDDYFYCPASNESFSATISAFSNGNSSQQSFTVADADAFFDNTAYYGVDGIFNGLAGQFSGTFDWGLPFFYGRTVFVSVYNPNTPNTHPYVAF